MTNKKEKEEIIKLIVDVKEAIRETKEDVKRLKQSYLQKGWDKGWISASETILEKLEKIVLEEKK